MVMFVNDVEIKSVALDKRQNAVALVRHPVTNASPFVVHVPVDTGDDENTVALKVAKTAQAFTRLRKLAIEKNRQLGGIEMCKDEKSYLLKMMIPGTRKKYKICVDDSTTAEQLDVLAQRAIAQIENASKDNLLKAIIYSLKSRI